MEYVTRQRTKSEWEAKNPFLRVGELGLERDTGKIKIGAVATRWNQLPYVENPPPLYPSTFDPPNSSGGSSGPVTAGDVTGVFSDNQIPAGVARDSEVATAVGPKYTFPAGGIPETDLAAGVRAKLGVGGGSSTPALLTRITSLVTPKLTRLLPTVATRAQVGLSSIYATFMMRVPDNIRTAYPQFGKWRLYTSTDHDGVGPGGVAMLYTDATDPTAAGTVWTPYRTPSGAVSIYDEGGSLQTETPWLLYVPRLNGFLMWTHIDNLTVQTTRVAFSADGVTNWSAPQTSIPNLPSDIAGYNHTGYAKVWDIDGLYCAWHTIGAGTVSSGYGWSYSYDGLNFLTDRRRYTPSLQDTDGLLRIGFSGLFELRNQLWASGSMTEYIGGGGVASGTNIPWVAPMNDNLRSIKGRPRMLDRTLLSGELAEKPPGLPPNWAQLDDGRLVGCYRVTQLQKSNDYLRLAVLSL